MAFWSFDTGGGGGGGAHPDKAAHDLLNIDADTLDGFDVVDFVRFAQHTKALHDALGLDAATLDGFDSADFVRFAQHTKALHDALLIDAATLDGIDSTGFSLAGHSHGGALTVVRKTADEQVVSSNVVQDDDELVLAIAANEVWIFYLVLFFTAASAGDILVDISVPAGATLLAGSLHSDPTDAATPFLIHTDVVTESSGQWGSAGAGAAVMYAIADGIVLNGANAGNLQVQWAQLTSNATPTVVKANSFLTANRVSP